MVRCPLHEHYRKSPNAESSCPFSVLVNIISRIALSRDSLRSKVYGLVARSFDYSSLMKPSCSSRLRSFSCTFLPAVEVLQCYERLQTASRFPSPSPPAGVMLPALRWTSAALRWTFSLCGGLDPALSWNIGAMLWRLPRPQVSTNSRQQQYSF